MNTLDILNDSQVKICALKLLQILEKYNKDMFLQQNDKDCISFYWRRYQFLVDIFSDCDGIHIDGKLHFKADTGGWFARDFYYIIKGPKDDMIERVAEIGNLLIQAFEESDRKIDPY